MLKVQALYEHCFQGLTSIFLVQYSSAFFLTWVKNQEDTAWGRDVGEVPVSYKANFTLFANCNRHNTFSSLEYLEYLSGSSSLSKATCLASHFQPYNMMPFLLLSDILFSQVAFFFLFCLKGLQGWNPLCHWFWQAQGIWQSHVYPLKVCNIKHTSTVLFPCHLISEIFPGISRHYYPSQILDSCVHS